MKEGGRRLWFETVAKSWTGTPALSLCSSSYMNTSAHKHTSHEAHPVGAATCRQIIPSGPSSAFRLRLFLGKSYLFYKCTKQVTMATELREELLLFRSQSFILRVGTSHSILGMRPDDWYAHISMLWQKDWQKTLGVGRGGRLTLLGGKKAGCF